MGFATGLLTGIAEGANKVISQDIADAKLETRQLARLRAERTMQRSDKRDEELRENIAQTQKLAAKIGPGADIILKNLISRYGMQGAVEATEDLLVAAKNANVSPATYAGVAVDAINAFPTKDQLKALAQYGTAPVKPIEVADPNVGGWAKILGVGGPDRVKEISSSLVTSGGGISKQDLTGLPQDAKLPGLNTAFPINRTFAETKDYLLKNFISVKTQLDNTTDPEQKTKLRAVLERTKGDLNNIVDAAELLNGGVDLTVRYRRQMDNGDEDGAEKTLKMINAIARAKEGTPSITSSSRVDGSFLQQFVNTNVRLVDTLYKRGQGGMTASINGKVVELDANQVESANISEQIQVYETAINMAVGAPNIDQEGRTYLNNVLRPKLKLLKQRRDAAMQTASGLGQVEQTIDPSKDKQAVINPNIDKTFNKLKVDPNVDKYISRAKSVISKGVGSQAYTTFKSALRAKTRESGYGNLDDMALDTLITRLGAQGQ
tara:strand:- start:1712 stop:3187 length:1476 start_codon:yes stop_codon:yes gene_type:complete